MMVEASAPSNIALIKYMGKIEGTGNKPTNSSLSWTLENLRTFVRLSTQRDIKLDQWAPLKREGVLSLALSEKSVQRFLQHLQNLKSEFGIEENFLVESANNFPSDCGLASSASSFAALTMAATEAFAKLGNEKAKSLSVSEKAELSRKGSGSSCRSFFSPWAIWEPDCVRPVQYQISELLHQVVVVESSVKEVSSSEAHKRVTSSRRFQGRAERAEMRLAQLSELFSSSRALSAGSWKQAYQIIWDEFIDMHELFETSVPAFSYMTEGSRAMLESLKTHWKTKADGPLVTMDAGANIHLLYRPDQAALARSFEQIFSKKFKVYSSFENQPAQGESK